MVMMSVVKDYVERIVAGWRKYYKGEGPKPTLHT